MLPLALTGLTLGSLSLLGWLGVLVHPARPWALRPREGELDAADPSAWPSVRILVPARNEAELLPRTLPALLAQDYPGEHVVAVVDDRSSDATAEVARAANAAVVHGAPLPDGWVGKVWALEQGARGATEDYLLLTDADIRHSPRSLRRLVSQAEARDLDLVSRMAWLRCESPAERMLIPAFVFFFNLLYPMRWANEGRRPAAAGGCVLLRRAALDHAGGFASIRDAVIDDISLAREVAGRTQLALAEEDVVSLREHDTFASIWQMVARTAFAELHYSQLRVAFAAAGLALLFPLPPLLVLVGIFLAAISHLQAAALVGLPGLAAWTLQAALYAPTIRYFAQPLLWIWTLPLAGTLYGAMTIDSSRGTRP